MEREVLLILLSPRDEVILLQLYEGAGFELECPMVSFQNPSLISMDDRNENESRVIEIQLSRLVVRNGHNIRLDRNSAAEQRIVKREELGSMCRPLNPGWLSNNEYLHRDCACKRFGTDVGSRPDSRVSLWSLVVSARCI